MERKKTFSLDLSSLRSQLDISQRELARRMDIAQPSLKQIEDNFNDIRLSSLKKYITALDMTLTIQVETSAGDGKFYLLKEVPEMDNEESFFKKLESAESNANAKVAEQTSNLAKKKRADEEGLIFFRDEANKLSNKIKSELGDKMIVQQQGQVVHSDHFNTEVMATNIVHGAINVSLNPTGPRFGTALGNGVIQLNSNSSFFRNNPRITYSLILKNKKDDVHWVLHTRDDVSGSWGQERLDNEVFYKLLSSLFFAK